MSPEQREHYRQQGAALAAQEPPLTEEVAQNIAHILVAARRRREAEATAQAAS